MKLLGKRKSQKTFNYFFLICFPFTYIFDNNIQLLVIFLYAIFYNYNLLLSDKKNIYFFKETDKKVLYLCKIFLYQLHPCWTLFWFNYGYELLLKSAFYIRNLHSQQVCQSQNLHTFKIKLIHVQFENIQ